MSATATGTRNGRLRVLLIEDDPDDYRLTREFIDEIPGGRFDLVWVRDFAAGLAALTRCEHDVCLLDYRLGAHDGLELLRAAHDSGCKAPTILLTGQGDRDLALQALDAGAADYLVKDKLDAVTLERAIRYALQQKRHADELERRVADRTEALQRANRAYQSSEERYRLMVEGATGFAIIMLDMDGHVTTWNVGAHRLFGYTEAEVLNTHFSRFFTPDDIAAGKPERELRQARDNELGNDDNQLVCKNGTRFWASGATTALRDEAGNLRGYSKIVRDVSDRKRAEQALELADRNKNEFLAMLAHELRNPLAPIANAVQILRLTSDKLPVVEQASQTLARQTAQLVRLVDDLLDVSRISQGKIELRLERVDLAAAMQHAADAARSLADCVDQQLAVTPPRTPIHLRADPARLAQILGNLLSNACKFTDRGGRIALGADRDGDDAVIRVRDNGIGLAVRELPRIFELFTQVDRSLERSRGGLGIGLTLVRQLVEMHGGSVHAESGGAGQGSEFIVRLPIAALDAASTRAQDTAPPLVTGHRILVVDDNRDSADSLAMLLAMSGNETHTEHDGLAAIEAARKLRPDVVLLDIGLPRLNGYDAARRIRAEPWGGDVVLVALTGFGQDEDRKKSQAAGFDGHLVKPVDQASLARMLADMRPRQ